MQVALFVTCFNDTLFPDTGRAVVGVLERLGIEVDFPLEQTCCGQMHLNSGYRHEAARLAGRFVEIFDEFELVVAPSSSCVGTVRELYPGLLGSAPPVCERVLELSELLVHRLGRDDVGASFPHRVAYHPTCHSLRVTRVGDAPLRLLRNVRGLELVELPAAEECCGFGGTFALKNPDVSAAMGARKVSNVLGTGAEVLVAADNSCLAHLGGTLTRWRTGVRTLHLAEVLAATGEAA